MRIGEDAGQLPSLPSLPPTKVLLSSMEDFPNHCPRFGSWRKGCLCSFLKGASLCLMGWGLFYPPPKFGTCLEGAELWKSLSFSVRVEKAETKGLGLGLGLAPSCSLKP